MSEIAPPDLETLRVDTPLGAVNFPMLPGVKARGSASVDPDGAVKIHVIVDAIYRTPRRHRVYAVRRNAGDFGLLVIELLRDDGACPI